MISLEANAKLNLSLELLNVERDDGYHEISTVMQTISLSDHITMEESSDIYVTCDLNGWDPEKSLISRAIVLMQKEIATDKGVHIHIAKNIPLSSGLGGDSSDAAAVIVGLNQLWDGRIGNRELHHIASRLGSDMPFFIDGGTQWSRGRGEKLTPLSYPGKIKAVVVYPDVQIPSGKTKALYGEVQKCDLTNGDIVNSLQWKINTNGNIVDAEKFNVFTGIGKTVYRGIDKAVMEFEVIAGRQILLSGAGPALFAIFGEDEDVSSVVKRLKTKGYTVWDCVFTDRRYSM